MYPSNLITSSVRGDDHIKPLRAGATSVGMVREKSNNNVTSGLLINMILVFS